MIIYPENSGFPLVLVFFFKSGLFSLSIFSGENIDGMKWIGKNNDDSNQKLDWVY